MVKLLVGIEFFSLDIWGLWGTLVPVCDLLNFVRLIKNHDSSHTFKYIHNNKSLKGKIKLIFAPASDDAFYITGKNARDEGERDEIAGGCSGERRRKLTYL